MHCLNFQDFCRLSTSSDQCKRIGQITTQIDIFIVFILLDNNNAFDSRICLGIVLFHINYYEYLKVLVAVAINIHANQRKNKNYLIDLTSFRFRISTKIYRRLPNVNIRIFNPIIENENAVRVHVGYGTIHRIKNTFGLIVALRVNYIQNFP